MDKVFKTWYKPLQGILSSKYFNKLVQHLETQYDLSRFAFNKIKIYPEDKKNVFKCFGCDFEKLKVVFIGNEPFDDYSDGLAFDTNMKKIQLHPVSEVIRWNIEKEFYNGFNLDHDCTLEYLMNQGVLLLNEALTTTSTKDHKDLWKEFTTAVIAAIHERHTGIIFCMKKDSEFIKLINPLTQYILIFDDPSDYEYNPAAWDFKFQTINDIILQNNGKDYEIKF